MSGRDFTYDGEKVKYQTFHVNSCLLFDIALHIDSVENLMLNIKKVYLSGTNTAWISYGYDFGNNAWADHGDQWVAELDRVGPKI